MRSAKMLLLIDGLGAVLVAGCAWVGAWYGVWGTVRTSGELTELSSTVEDLETTFVRLKNTLEAKQEAYQQRLTELGQRELLPEKTPAEENLRAIAELVRQSQLELLELTPAESRRYPGVIEQRYELRLSGAFTDYVRFFKAFEASPFWGDIVGLRLTSTNAQAPGGKSGLMTVSLYSTVTETPKVTSNQT